MGAWWTVLTGEDVVDEGNIDSKTYLRILRRYYELATKHNPWEGETDEKAMARAMREIAKEVKDGTNEEASWTTK